MKPSRTTPLPIPCATWVNQLAAVHPDDLSPDEQAALKQHLAECLACAAVYVDYQRIDSRILSLPVVELSTRQIAEMEARIANQPARNHDRSLTTVRQDHRMPPARVPARLMRADRRVSTVAALLVVTVLITSAFALFSRHHTPSAALPVAHNTLYTVSYAGTIYALNPLTGGILWHTPLQMTPDEQFIVSGGTIFLTSSCIRSTCDLYALQAGDGHLLWQRSYKSLLGNAGASSLTRYLASDGQTLFIGSATGIYAWRASDGKQLWYHAPPAACVANPSACLIDMETASNGMVYVYFDGLYALNASDGTTSWSNLQVPNLDFTAYPLAVADNHIYVPNYGGSVTVHVLQADTGRLLDTPGLPQDAPYDILTDGSVVYMRTTPSSGGSADIYALRGSDNHLLWHVHDANVVSLAAVSAGSLYYSYLAASSSAAAQRTPITPGATIFSPNTATTRLCAVRTADGSLQWCQSLPAGYFPSAAASQGILYAPGISQGLDAMRLSDGKLLWHILANVSLDDADTVLA